MKEKCKPNGFSLVEIILAVALFVIFSSGLVTLVLQSYSSSRLGSEETIATQYATEGVEAVRSIKNQAYSNLANSAAVGVTRNVNNVWQFAGTNNSYGKYSRTLKVEDVYRDGLKNIVASGGALDSDTKKITSTVSWGFSSGRTNSVVLTTYLTNWRADLATPTPSSCNEYAINQGYASGVCRQNEFQCTLSGETYLNMGDTYCLIPPADTCCALAGLTPTLTPTSTPTVSPTLTPTPTVTPANCNQYCQQKYATSGSCQKVNNCQPPLRNEGQRYECIGSNRCCCQ